MLLAVGSVNGKPRREVLAKHPPRVRPGNPRMGTERSSKSMAHTLDQWAQGTNGVTAAIADALGAPQHEVEAAIAVVSHGKRKPSFAETDLHGIVGAAGGLTIFSRWGSNSEAETRFTTGWLMLWEAKEGACRGRVEVEGRRRTVIRAPDGPEGWVQRAGRTVSPGRPALRTRMDCIEAVRGPREASREVRLDLERRVSSWSDPRRPQTQKISHTSLSAILEDHQISVSPHQLSSMICAQVAHRVPTTLRDLRYAGNFVGFSPRHWY